MSVLAQARPGDQDKRDLGFGAWLRENQPAMTQGDVERIAAVWNEELDRIIKRMMAISESTMGSAMHIDSRTAMLFEVAKMRAWLFATMLAKKATESIPQAWTAEWEHEALEGDAAKSRVESTAQLLAEHGWNRIVEQLRAKWPLVVSASEAKTSSPRGKLEEASRGPGVRWNHYSPVFSNKRWANGGDRLVREYSRSLDGSIRSRDISYRVWGREQFLYSRGLEKYLQLVDGDGAESFQKILEVQPLTSLDKRRLIAFLIIQLIRNPAFVRAYASSMLMVSNQMLPGYVPNLQDIRSAYESLFRDNGIYRRFHNVMAAREWTMLTAPAGAYFLRPDSTILIEGRVSSQAWRLIYPVTPERAISVGPEMGKGYEQDFVFSSNLDLAGLDEINRRLARTATRTVIAVALADDSALRNLLAENLGVHREQLQRSMSADMRLWGALSDTTL